MGVDASQEVYPYRLGVKYFSILNFPRAFLTTNAEARASDILSRAFHNASRYAQWTHSVFQSASKPLRRYARASNCRLRVTRDCLNLRYIAISRWSRISILIRKLLVIQWHVLV